MEQNLVEAKKVLKSWGASPEQESFILQLHETDEVIEERCNLVLSIDWTLNALFQNPANKFGFMAMQNDNAYFNGRSPLDLISTEVDSLEPVTMRLRALLNPY
ncbi:hypothetical protein [Photobacterium sanguinicancri]|uniref:hypothetical protein n=1 Tax=Photobacterium sanguinicancri TaxID=875932 RepID=UPI0007881CB7|nr:hypothetical protein [Photobacterium sanguinicancri]KXI23088.1 hypothetical protein AS132_09390 [Photobacterium sanguinicancri]